MPPCRAVRPEAASSVAPVVIHYRDSLRPCLGTAIAPRRRARFRQTLLDELDFVADGDLARLDDPGQHSPLPLELGAEAVAELVHPVAGVADHRDLEQRLANADLLAHRPLLDVGPLDGEVLANRA